MAGLRTRQREAASARCHVALVQILPLAQHEYIEAYDTDTWRDTIRTSHEQSADHMSPDPQSPPPQPAPAPAPAAAPDASPTSE